MAMLSFKKPMGAHPFSEKRASFPCYVQPKLDGVRCVTDGVEFWSRNGHPFSKWNTRHLRRKRLRSLVDSEFMIREGGDFEDLASIARRHKHPDCEDLQLNVFDVMSTRPFIERLEMVRILFDDIDDDAWVLVPTVHVHTMAQLTQTHKKNLKAGYEGSMVRTISGLYVPRKSFDLLKYKPLQDAEFKIVRVREAQGKDKGTPIYVCKSKGGEFSVRPKGTMKQRKAMWRDRKSAPGKDLTVEFQNLTKYGKPRFPRAKVLRDYE